MLDQVHQSLTGEIARSEKQRIQMYLYVLGVALGLTVLNYVFFHRQTSRLFVHPWSYPSVMISLTVFMLYEVLTLYWVQRRTPSAVLVYLNTTLECLLLSGLLYTVGYLEGNTFVLHTPITLLYPLFAIASALHLKAAVSMYAGLVAGLFYLLTYLLLGEQVSEINQVYPEVFIYLESALFVLCGLCAGMVAREIRRKLLAALRLQQDNARIQMLFGQQVSRQIVETLLRQQEEANRAEVSVMFLDIRNFSAFAEGREPEEIIAFQNHFFSPIIDIVNQHGGVVCQIMGDGLMAVFGAPVYCEKHSCDALQAGLAILEKVVELAQEQLIPPTRVGIGLHTGEVVTGNIGNHTRKQFSVSGTPVIIASRIEQLNKEFNSQFLISESLFQSLQGWKDQLHNAPFLPLVDLGLVSLKGIDQSVKVFKVA